MNIELTVLAWTLVLGLLQIGVAAAAMTHQRGLGWNVSARDGQAAALTGVAARLDRASKNFLETFPFFVAAVLAVVVAQKTSADTALGVQLYFWARVAYVPIYAAGIPYLRTAVYGVAIWGLVKLISALL